MATSWASVNGAYITITSAREIKSIGGASVGRAIADTSHSSGKYYMEYSWSSMNTGIRGNSGSGICDNVFPAGNWGGSATENSEAYFNDGVMRLQAATLAGNPTITTGDIVGLAVDLDNGWIHYYINNVLTFSIMCPIGVPMYPCASIYWTNEAMTASWSNAHFTYSPPTGYLEWDAAEPSSANEHGKGFYPPNTYNSYYNQFSNSDKTIIATSPSIRAAYAYKTHTGSGKWFAEFTLTRPDSTTTGYGSVGISSNISNTILAQQIGVLSSGVTQYAYRYSGNKLSANVSGLYGTAWTTGTAVIGVALDLDAATIQFYLNGVSQGVAYSGIATGSSWYLGASSQNHSSYDTTITVNTIGPFTYSAPSGYQPWDTGPTVNMIINRPKLIYMHKTQQIKRLQ